MPASILARDHVPAADCTNGGVAEVLKKLRNPIRPRRGIIVGEGEDLARRSCDTSSHGRQDAGLGNRDLLKTREVAQVALDNSVGFGVSFTSDNEHTIRPALLGGKRSQATVKELRPTIRWNDDINEGRIGPQTHFSIPAWVVKIHGGSAIEAVRTGSNELCEVLCRRADASESLLVSARTAAAWSWAMK